MDQFTTFRGAAESAGKLNAMLGGTINSMELVAPSAKGPDEALKVLGKGVDASGKSFEELGFFGKKAIADSIGVDAQTAAKLFSGEIGSVEEAQKAATEAAKKKADQDAKLNEMMEKAIPAATKFTELFNQMAPAIETIIGAIHALLDPLVQFTQFIGPEATAAIVGLAAAFMFGRKIILASRAAKIAETTATALQTIASGEAAGAKSLEAGSNIRLAASQKVLAASNTLLSASFSTLAGLALMILAFGAAVALAGFGINMMFENVELEKVLALVGFFAAAALAAPFMVIAGVGLMLVAAGMLLLGLALLTVSTEDLQAMAMAMDGMGRAAEAGTGPLDDMIEFMDHLEDVADDIDEDGLEGIASVFRNIASIQVPEGGAGGIMELLKVIGENSAAIENLSRLSSVITDLSIAMEDLGLAGIISSFGLASMFDSIGSLGNIGVPAVDAIQGTVSLIEKVSTLDSTAVDQAEDLLEQAAEFMESASGATEAGSLSGILEKLTSGLTGDSRSGGGSAGSDRPIILTMDAAGRKIMARGIIKDLMPEINKQLDARLN
jgi:hypothetical protein